MFFFFVSLSFCIFPPCFTPPMCVCECDCVSGMGAASCLLCIWFIPTPAFNHLIRNNIRTPASLPFFGRLFHQLQLYYSLGHSLLCFCELSSSVVFLVLQVMFFPYAYTFSVRPADLCSPQIVPCLRHWPRLPTPPAPCLYNHHSAPCSQPTSASCLQTPLSLSAFIVTSTLHIFIINLLNFFLCPCVHFWVRKSSICTL